MIILQSMFVAIIFLAIEGVIIAIILNSLFVAKKKIDKVFDVIIKYWYVSYLILCYVSWFLIFNSNVYKIIDTNIAERGILQKETIYLNNYEKVGTEYIGFNNTDKYIRTNGKSDVIINVIDIREK